MATIDDLRKIFFENVSLKAVSLLLAFLLWFNVSSEQVIDRTLSIPVEFLNTPADLEISNDYAKMLDVHVRTRRGFLNSTNNSGISAVVNLQGATRGERIIPITEANIRKPDGVTISNVSPSRITLVLERTVHKLVPIEPVIAGTPLPGYQISRVWADPGEIQITGPESRVNRAFKAITEVVHVSGAKRSIQRDVNVDISDSKLRIERVNPVRVEVLIEEERAIEKITIPLSLGKGLRAAIKSVQLQVSYPKNYRKTLKPSMFIAKVDRSALGSSKEREVVPTIAITGLVDRSVRIDKVNPERVKVRMGS
ncbi:MAG TPA: CdaR family protein [Acidobacteriota bacterium]|jgi:YbbR domain-containing protein